MMVRQLQDVQVTVVGLGLMGGSLAAALRGQCRTVTGVARRAETVDAALARGLVDRATVDLAGGVSGADVVVLATPVRTILHQIAEIGPLLPDGCLLLDLGSTKTEIVNAMALLPEHVQPLGGHPMCGKESSGPEAADPALYRSRTFVLCPLPRTSQPALALAVRLVGAVGAHPLLLDPQRHDSLVATASHLPYLLACALVATAGTAASSDPAVGRLLASGFRDTSRLAGSDVAMMLDILLTNRLEILKAVDSFQAQLDAMRRVLETADGEAVRAALSAIRAGRLRMLP
jgi:prephenate dehydrogenase